MPDAISVPVLADWEDAELVLDGEVWNVRILIGPGGTKDLTPIGVDPVDYQTWVRINDNPEAPVRKPGVVTVE